MLVPTFLFLLTALCGVSALQDYQQRLPNGYRVSHPCFENTVWKGVGHQFHGGGGTLNPFGEDFRSNGFQWDEQLCQMDSDNDGRSNGEELGDPDCVWQPDELPDVGDGITHPGVCEPTDSPQCSAVNTWDVCAPVEFDCPGMEEDNTAVVVANATVSIRLDYCKSLGTESLDLRFSEITIPSEETSYYCSYVKFDETRDLQAFAMAPFVVNEALVHHIDMYECSDPSDGDKAGQPPQPCHQMGGCGGDMLAAWAVGINGLCMNEDVGIRLGKHGAKAASLRVHYHNPLHKENETDSSGLTYYVTPDIRANDARVLNIGQMYLELPPAETEIFAEARCGHVCTESLEEDIHLVFGAMHMHYLGTGGYSELWRDGKKEQTIMTQDFYDYNAPHIENFPNPITVKPGDTIRHFCRFQSQYRTDITWRGQAATDEMCHAYFVYYPAQNLTQCFNNGALETCSYRDRPSTSHWDELCDRDGFLDVYNGYMREALEATCDTQGEDCLPGCDEALEWAYANHTCLDENKRTAIFKYHGEFRAMQSTCKYQRKTPEEPDVNSATCPQCQFLMPISLAICATWKAIV